MDTAHMKQRVRNTIYLYVGYWYLDMGLDMGLDGPIQFDGGGCTGANLLCQYVICLMIIMV
jgi:hypothetical protein